VAVLDGRETTLPAGQVVEMGSGGHGGAALHVRPDGKGLAVALVSDGAVALHQPFSDVPPEQGYEEIEGFTYGGEGAVHAYAARKGERWQLVVNGRPGPEFDRVVDPAFSADGKRFVYRARAAGKRFVVVGDCAEGTTRRFAAHEQVFQARFTGDGWAVAYGVKDGRRLTWKVEPL
jgi:hypothetical protein